MSKLFSQNVIAVIWDFDRTIVDGYMQKPLFEYYNIDGNKFWEEVNSLEEKYFKQGIRVNKDTIYLNHIITCISQGILPGLNNEILRKLGSKLDFYKGIPQVLKEMVDKIHNNPDFKKHSIKVEHYIISTGLAEMIKGSNIFEYVNGIWGCEFIEDPIKSALKGKDKKEDKKRVITQVGYAIDNTSKTRAIFEINKGANLFNKKIDVNSRVIKEDRRVPFENMIYIADGPSDVPVFSLLKQNKGHTYAVYTKGDMNAFEKADRLMKDERIDAYGEADYSKNTHTYMWLMLQINSIAERIYRLKEEVISNSVSSPPRH